MEKINLVELLKDCLEGMELDCAAFKGLEFDHIDENNGTYPIICRVKTEFGSYNIHTFTKYGCYSTAVYSKCIIFPKGKKSWTEFIPPRQFKDGDIVITNYDNIAIISNKINDKIYRSYCELFEYGAFMVDLPVWPERLATEEEKQRLFQAIKDNDYKWNKETKTLEKLIKPKFKVGDIIKSIFNKSQYKITELTDTHYTLVEVDYKYKYTEPIIEDKYWTLVSIKFDINTLKPFDKVLVRRAVYEKWNIDFFDFYNEGYYYATGGCMYIQCIPYEGNEHLRGTTDDCDAFYKTWK